MLSIPDMALLGVAALIFFGPDQLPRVARKAGLFIRDMQNTSQSFIREMERAGEPPPVPYEPYVPPAAYESPAYEPAEASPTVSDATGSVVPPASSGRTVDFDPPAPDPVPPPKPPPARTAAEPSHAHEAAP